MQIFVSTPNGRGWMDVDPDDRVSAWKDRVRRAFRIPYDFSLVHYNLLYLPHTTPVPDDVFISELPWNGRAHVIVKRRY